MEHFPPNSIQGTVSIDLCVMCRCVTTIVSMLACMCTRVRSVCVMCVHARVLYAYVQVRLCRAGRYTNFGDGTVFYKISRYK